MSLQITRDSKTGRELYKVRIPDNDQVYVFEGDVIAPTEPEPVPLDDLDALLNDSSPTLKRPRPIGSPTREQKQEQEQTCPRKPRAKLPKSMQPSPEMEQELVQCAEQTLRVAMWNALQPVYAFVGKVETMLGGSDVRRHYRWLGKQATLREQQIPVVSNNKNIAQFWENNMHLGTSLLAASLVAIGLFDKGEEEELKTEQQGEQQEELKTEEELEQGTDDPSGWSFFENGNDDETEEAKRFIEESLMGTRRLKFNLRRNVGRQTVQFKHIGSNTPNATLFLPVTQEEHNLLQSMMGEEQALLHPDWILSVLHVSAFQFMLRQTSFGAFELAATELSRLPNFKFVARNDMLIDLILSDNVSDMFAEFVASKFLMASGGNAYPSRIYPSGGMQYNVSAGFKTRAARSKWTLGCKYWFQHVRYISNPVRPRITASHIQSLREERERYSALEILTMRHFHAILSKMNTIANDEGVRLSRDPSTRIFVVPETVNNDELRRLQKKAKDLYHRIYLYVENRIKKDAQIAKYERERQSYRPHVFVYQAPSMKKWY